jgi:hypothetical protein
MQKKFAGISLFATKKKITFITIIIGFSLFVEKIMKEERIAQKISFLCHCA